MKRVKFEKNYAKDNGVLGTFFSFSYPGYENSTLGTRIVPALRAGTSRKAKKESKKWIVKTYLS